MFNEDLEICIKIHLWDILIGGTLKLEASLALESLCNG